MIYNNCKNLPAGILHFESTGMWPASIDLPGGVYFMKIFSEKITAVRKIVKVKH
jgi:hypothetical protein